MQLLALVLYNANGQSRVVDFKTGALNVVTGQSASGKSALLDIFEYCTGRKTATFPIGPLTDTVSWYAALFQLDTTRAFAARPAPGPGRKTAEQAMLKFGPHLEPPPYTDLVPNTDRRTLRQRLGRFIGIEETHSTTTRDHGPASTGAHLGHATLLCLQSQNEIADKSHLFHRQSDRHVADALKQTLPYFLGVAPHDQARKHAQLNAARSRLEQAEKDLTQAQDPNDTTHVTLAALWHEAHTLNLIPVPSPPDDLVQAMQMLQDAVLSPAPQPPGVHEEDQRALDLERSCADLREQLRALAADRRLLLAETAAADDYVASARIPRGRLASFELIPPPPEGDDARTCVLCGSVLPQPDPSISTLRSSLDRLQRQLDGVDAMRPARRAALETLHQQTTQLRTRLRAAEHALQALAHADQTNGHLPHAERIDFARGRIHGMLTALQRTTGADLARLSQAREAAHNAVKALEAELDPATQHKQLRARLVTVNQDITQWARQLQLERGNQDVRLDPDLMTVEFATGASRVPLARLGSGQNWVGYHILAHLALHRYFVRQRRPVPRILFLDQPSQVWFPPTTQDGHDPDNEDTHAAQQLFQLIHEVVKDLAPHLQVIVCDHVDFPAPWFQEAVVHRWRHSEKLVPAHWVDASGPHDRNTR